MEDVKILSQALSYIMEFHGKTVVIKYGGNAMKDEETREKVIRDIALLKYVGMLPVVVHGGGPAINEMLYKLDKKPEFKMGNRVTDRETIDIVEMVLGGKVNKEIVSLLNKNGTRAVGITGKDSNMIMAEKKYINIDGEKIDIGYVGQVQKIDTEIIENLLEAGIIPVIAPLGTDKDGNTYNINADYVAGEIASALKAAKLILMTDIDGIYRDINDKDTLIHEIGMEEVGKLTEDGIICGGMIPKVESSVSALKNGVEKVHILNGQKEHSILMELFTKDGIGTMIMADYREY
ncbi:MULTISPECIES: acetylglutamate kinase [Psychrilyobacter]|uniref:Acetylglutamate kinase n=1 Tax=Psychrilyobacter piezotolerans TaxID=2293438 RepID=A0ABX9KDZ4_9FUSO|nr:MULTISPECIES: acetylglutamate kinase [Psychrilyobacter]MCS5422011.1 acetylglutamate kinase [Psychrilyobacter sp. S5]NDI78929.1 acetylglutamate kinase [Psychrilyobacter piezotolerans]RDE59321.1 acetylglutamate kinase [Psychrilyobacter sp. S5]REI39851.1 acetylglutamate kinase [Psychrilyobacter piezotolerans]